MQMVRAFFAFVGYVLVSGAGLFFFPLLFKFFAENTLLGEAAYAGGMVLYALLWATVVAGLIGMFIVFLQAVVSCFPKKKDVNLA